jgi:hypothetical protein
MYFRVTLDVQITDHLNNLDNAYVSQSYRENWDIAEYEPKIHSTPIIGKIEGMIDNEGGGFSVLVEGIDAENLIDLQDSYTTAFKEGKSLIKKHLNNLIVTHF